MKINKVNTKLLRALSHGIAPVIVKTEDAIYLSDDGRAFHRIAGEEILFNVAKFKHVDLEEVIYSFEMVEFEEKIKPTNTYKLIGGDTMVHQYYTDKFNIYIEDSLLSCFEYPDLYAHHSDSRVLVLENGEIVGLVMPSRVI